VDLFRFLPVYEYEGEPQKSVETCSNPEVFASVSLRFTPP